MQLLVWILLFSQLAFSGAGKIEESYYVHSQSSSLKRSIIQHPELILDHPSSRGFELYGPVGLGQYLKNLGVKFEPLEKIEKLKNTKALENYPSYEMVVKRLQAAVSKYSSIMKLFSVGKTVEGRDLWVVKISKNVNVDEVEPEFKYIANMHGDEIVGRELMQNLIEDLGRSYVAGERAVVDLVDRAEVFIMPSMNPDGAEEPQRGNGNDVDLNRNFPDETVNPSSPQSASTGWGRGFQSSRLSLDYFVEELEPETIAVMKFNEVRNFSLSANFHGGAVVMNYAWDAIDDRHPLDEFLIDLALDYSKLNPTMWNSSEFSRGITNGADWYIVKGGMQDWSYIKHNDLQFTVELSNIKYPDFGLIPKFYAENKSSFMVMMENIFQGKGFYWKSRSGENGLVEVTRENGTTLGKFPWKGGEFYKVLPPGIYEYRIFDSKGSELRKFSVAVEQAQTPGSNLKPYIML